MAKKAVAVDNDVTGWVGWVGFAAVLLMMVGVFHLLAGFVSLFQEDVLFKVNNSVFLFDSSAWGWIHIVGGALSLGAGASLLKGGLYGRIFGVVVAVLSALSAMAFATVYPVWSIIIIAVDVLVIWGIVGHGDEVKEVY